MTGHLARAERMGTGWRRWVARCSCGWFEWPRVPGGKEAAESLAEAHRARWAA